MKSVISLYTAATTTLLLLSSLQASCAPVIDHHQLPLFQGSTIPSSQYSDFSLIASLTASAHQVLAPEAWIQLEEHLAELQHLPRRRVRLSDSNPYFAHLGGAVLEVSEGEKALLILHRIKFDDITDDLDSQLTTQAVSSSSSKESAEYPSKWTYSKKRLEKTYYSNIDTNRMKDWLVKFSSFRTRYYRSSSGKDSQAWLKATVESIAYAKKELNMTVKEFPHEWGQNSIIATLPVANDRKAKGRIVIGAHQDSTNLLPFLGAPGADDDGSGTTTVLEVLHGLVNASHIPKNYNIEFHWYSAEEGGMLGSNAIAGDYQRRLQAGQLDDSDRVRAMLQMDMTAYIKPGTTERIGIIQDFVDPTLTSWIEGLIDNVNDIPSVSTKCGYACSDHSSWTKIGVPSAFAIEATFEDSNTRNIHTGSDTIHVPGFSFDHMKQFVKLAMAFVLELSE